MGKNSCKGLNKINCISESHNCTEFVQGTVEVCFRSCGRGRCSSYSGRETFGYHHNGNSSLSISNKYIRHVKIEFGDLANPEKEPTRE